MHLSAIEKRIIWNKNRFVYSQHLKNIPSEGGLGLLRVRLNSNSAQATSVYQKPSGLHQKVPWRCSKHCLAKAQRIRSEIPLWQKISSPYAIGVDSKNAQNLISIWSTEYREKIIRIRNNNSSRNEMENVSGRPFMVVGAEIVLNWSSNFLWTCRIHICYVFSCWHRKFLDLSLSCFCCACLRVRTR